MIETERPKTEEQHKHEEQKIEVHQKERFNFKKMIKGSNRKESIENVSFLIIVIAAVMVSVGIGVGSFVQGTIFLSVFGSFFVMIGIVFYIASQFMGE